MRKLLYTLFYGMLLSCNYNNAQEIQNSYNLDAARELGLCYDDKKLMPGGGDIYYPLCSDSSVRVFFLEPNYYVTYVDDMLSCGSCGCHMKLFKKEVSNYINALDVCLLPNQKIVLAHGSNSSNISLNISTFTSPLKLFEYMSHKKPIIASDLPVIREVLNEKNSILVKCNDIDLWLSSIKKLKNFKHRETISTQVLSDFNNFTWKNRALRLIDNI